MRRRCISSDESTPATRQHVKPCADCPWRKDALEGSLTPREWLACAHGEGQAECHVRTGVQCAGMAIYRANVCKRPRDPRALILKSDRQAVFTSPAEFLSHHAKRLR